MRDTYERITGAIHGVRQGKNACGFFMNHPFFASAAGLTLEDYFSSPARMMEAQLETFRQIGYKNPLLPDFGVVPVASGFGCEVRFDNIGIPNCEKLKIEDIAELDGLQPVVPGENDYMGRVLEYLRYMKAHKPEDVLLGPSLVMGPFTAGGLLRGITEFCLDVLEEEERVHHLLDVITETEITYLNMQSEILGGLKYMVISDDLSSFLSAGQYEEFVVPCYRKIFASFPGVIKVLHNDGSAAHLVDAVSESGFDLWHVGADVDMSKAYRETECRIALIGGLHPVRVLAQMKPEEVYREAKEQLRRFAGAPGLILSAGGFINYGTPPENVRAVIRAAEDFELVG